MSVQLDRYLALRLEGLSRSDAAFESGLSAEEARLTDIANDRGEIAPPVAALNTEATTKENEMAKAPKKNDGVEEVVKPDFALAISLYKNDIRPAQAKVGEYAQEQSTAYKAIKKDAHVHPGAAKMAFKLNEMEDHKRDDFLRSLYGLMAALNIGISADLVDQMADDETPKMPVVERKPVELMAVN